MGRIRNELERLGLAENTLLVYTSDHGSHFRTRNAEYKRSCHDGCIRIPLIVHGPGFTGGVGSAEHIGIRRELAALLKRRMVAAGERAPEIRAASE